MEIFFKKITDPSEWDAFASTSHQQTLFCHSHFLKAFELRYDAWGFGTKDGKILLGVIVPLEANALVRYASLQFAEELYHYPPHHTQNLISELLTTMIHLFEEMYLKYSLKLHPRITDIRPFLWYNKSDQSRKCGKTFNIAPRYTSIIDLSAYASFEEYLSTIRKDRKSDYKKALSLNLTVETSNDTYSLIDLYNKTFKRTIEDFSCDEGKQRKFVEAAQKEGFGELLICRDSHNTPLSATFFVHDQSSAYYLIGANDPASRKTGSGTLVVLEAIKRCFEKKLEFIDLFGVNSPRWGDFKSSLNGIPTLYFDVYLNP